MEKLFEKVSATPSNPKWENMIKRENTLYARSGDVRSDFERDYTRILHCDAYKRMKHKTQVFFSPSNDHICTRIEHVNHVESISHTIAAYFGLNTELTKAIAIAHDLGHSPFGHAGEKILNQISIRDIGESFWHEKNGVYFVDNIELLEDDKGKLQNLNLTYAVRDGIISHCGEIDENSLRPRESAIDLKEYTKPNEYAPYTWEGCVIKISDKISYIGRDIEDALSLKLLDTNKIQELKTILGMKPEDALNNTKIINDLVVDICQNSSPERGLCFSAEKLKLIDNIKKYNYDNIYNNPRMEASNEFFKVVINRIYNTLKNMYSDSKNSIAEKFIQYEKFYPQIVSQFREWLNKYCIINDRKNSNLANTVLFDLNERDYCKAIIEFISGMTDNFAIDVYNEIVRF
ncbi:MAG: HD domain-containing protein [Clostridia bacterium]|nr:HD domain-containing protein [Clostridia bacterium]